MGKAFMDYRGAGPFNLPSFEIAFQPIVNLHNRTIIAYEALTRGVDGTPYPKLVAQLHTPALRAFHRRTAEAAIRRASELGILERNAMLTINLQPDLHRDALNAEFLADAAFRYGLTPADILIELTEDRRLSTSDYNKLMCQHKSAGFATVMDDFGAGYSGLSTLVECTPQILKLDRALIRDIDTCEVRQEIVKAFNNSCKALRITVVAEGIEKREEADMLLKIGVHTMQGYLFSRPVLNALPTAIHWHDDPRPFLGSGNVLSAFTVPLGLRDPFQPITLPA